MSLKRNFKVRVRDYKLAPPIEDAASCAPRTPTARQRILRHFALRIKISAMQRVRLRCAMRLRMLYYFVSDLVARLDYESWRCGIGIWAGAIRVGLHGADFASPSAPLKILPSGVVI